MKCDGEDYLVALHQEVDTWIDEDVGMDVVSCIDQSKFSYLRFYGELIGPNAHSVYREIEWE